MSQQAVPYLGRREHKLQKRVLHTMRIDLEIGNQVMVKRFWKKDHALSPQWEGPLCDYGQIESYYIVGMQTWEGQTFVMISQGIVKTFSREVSMKRG